MADQPLMHVVLHQPEIPQNAGNIGRTCVALGAKLWLVRPLGFRLDQSRLKRAGLDYWEHLNWEVVDTWADLQTRLADHRFWYFSKSAQQIFWNVQFQPRDVLVFGSETTGLPQSLLTENGTATLRLPIAGQVRSLNLACAVAVAGYELARQCRGQ